MSHNELAALNATLAAATWEAPSITGKAWSRVMRLLRRVII